MKKITVVILAAGEASRFWPFNKKHKSLVKIMGKPIILYAVKGLVDSGIKDIIVVQGPKKDIEQELSNYDLGVKIQYVVQREPEGMGDALFQAKDLIKGQFLLILAERIDSGETVRKLNLDANFTNSGKIIVGAKTDTPSLFGILKLEKNKVIDIVEKPRKGEEPSDIKALGVYVLTTDFFDVYKKIKKHQYDFEEALSLYVKKNDVDLMLWEKDTPSLKYPWQLFEMRRYLFSKCIKSSIGKNTKIAKSVEIIGDVSIGDNVSIMEKAVIKGPCYVGDNVFVGNNVILRGGVNVENDCVIGANMEIKNSLIMQGSTTHSGYIGDSVIGKNCRIAAGFLTANVRLDRDNVKATVKGEKIDTRLKMLGVMIGDNSNVGIKVTVMPGIIIGKNVIIGSNTTVVGNVRDDTKYYTKFQEIISKKNE